jgi:CBS domain containing-hemolysin-like protein
MSKDGRKSGLIWADLKKNDSVRPLTAILTLNTIAHTVGAVGVGSVVYEEYGNEWVTLASAILTMAVLLLSEILPKTLGTVYWKKLSPLAAHITNVLTLALILIVVPIEWFRKLLPKGNQTTVTRDELAVLADIGEEEGTIEEDEETVIQNLLRLAEIKVEEVMTPRVVVTAFPLDYTIKQVLAEHPVLRVSRIPVYGNNIDDIKGLVIRSEILLAASRDEWEKKLETLMKPIGFISEDASVDLTLDLFLEKRQQILAVQDEFGGTSGIVTMEDVIETLLGKEIVDETDEAEDMREVARAYTNGTHEGEE